MRDDDFKAILIVCSIVAVICIIFDVYCFKSGILCSCEYCGNIYLSNSKEAYCHELHSLDHIGQQGSAYIGAQVLTDISQVIHIEPVKHEIVQEAAVEKELEPEVEVVEIQGEIVKEESPVKTNRWDISLTDDERYLLACITFLEAGNQGLVGQEAVVEVIFNRMKDDYYGGSLYDVLSRKGQFVTWSNRNNATPTDETYKAIDEVLAGNTCIFNSEYLYFSRGGHKSHSGWVQLGDHQFCTK
jgi:hypothetical protein